MVVDYTHNVLWLGFNGGLKPITFRAQGRTDPLAVAPDLQALSLHYERESRQDMLAAAVTMGLRHAAMSLFDRQIEITDDLEDQSHYKDILTPGLPQHLCGKEEYIPPLTSAHTQLQEARHFQNGDIHIHIHTHMHIYIYIYMSADIHTYTYIHTRIQNVHMNARKARLKRRCGSDFAGGPA